MALITESMSARISIRPTDHFQNSLMPKSLVVYEMKSSWASPDCLPMMPDAEHGQHHVGIET